MKKFSRSGRLYSCGCVLCKNKKTFSYSTVQRHLTVYGKYKPRISTDDRIDDLCLNVPNIDETRVHDDDHGTEVDIHCDSSDQGSVCSRNTEDIAAPPSTTPCATDEANNCADEDHLATTAGLYETDIDESSSGSDDNEDDQVTTDNFFEVDCFEVQPQTSSTEPSPNVVSTVPLVPESNEGSTSTHTVHPIEQELPDESQSLFYLIKWISALLIKLQVKYKLSDSVLTALISILQLIFTIISHPLKHYFPNTIQGLSKNAGITNIPDYKRYVVCQNSECCELYDVSSDLEASTAPNCTKVKYNSQCKQSLFYERFLSFGKSRLVPYKTFVYISPIVWLKKFYSNESFKNLLCIQKEYIPESGIISDVWDGRVWQSFKVNSDCSFFKDLHNIALVLNVDWFKPFKRSEYKVGGIYMNILNLPRTERHKRKWTMLIGLIPGPNEPKENINSFLKPLVDDLIELWNGVSLDSSTGTMMKGALIMVSCDIPAARKVCQFLGHKANKGCSRCEFEAQRENQHDATSRMSYFTAGEAVPRVNSTVRQQAEEFLQARNKTEAKQIQKKNGIRWSELLRLPYFDIVTMTIVDPMHTIFLGMIRHETQLIFQDSLFCGEAQRVFGSRIKNLRVPYDVGRLPSSLAEKLDFSSLTADQWKNFALIYARPCLWNLLPPESYESICLLCEIVEITVQPALTNSDISRLDCLLKTHHQYFEKIYGKFEVSVNYHMALHFPNIIKDFGPPHSFWCFAFERMNGVLSGLPTNNRYIELELFMKFLQDANIESMLPPIHFVNNWPHLDNILPVEIEIPSQVHPMLLNYRAKSMFASPMQDRYEFQQSIDKGDIGLSGDEWIVEYLPPSRCDVQITKDLYVKLCHFYQQLYERDTVHVLPRIDKHARCLVNGLSLTSDLHGSDRSSIVKAYFAVLDSDEPYPYFGIVRFFFKSKVLIKGNVDSTNKTASHDLSYVQWFRLYDNSQDPPFQITDDFYEGDEIVSPRRFVSRCVVLKPYSDSLFKFIVELPG